MYFEELSPNAARDVAGPKELIKATVEISQHFKSPVLAVVSNMAISNESITRLEIAVFKPVRSFIFFSIKAISSVFSFISFNLELPMPYCKISDNPRRLSSIKVDSSPDCRLNCGPLSLLNFEVKTGINTPTQM